MPLTCVGNPEPSTDNQSRDCRAAGTAAAASVDRQALQSLLLLATELGVNAEEAVLRSRTRLPSNPAGVTLKVLSIPMIMCSGLVVDRHNESVVLSRFDLEGGFS